MQQIKIIFELIGGSSSSVYTYEADENQDSLILKNSDGQTVNEVAAKGELIYETGYF